MSLKNLAQNYADSRKGYPVKILSTGPPLFTFIDFDDWIRSAQIRFRNEGHTAQTAICVDAKGKVCTRGLHFKAARYPVTVWPVDDGPYKPSGMTGGLTLSTAEQAGREAYEEATKEGEGFRQILGIERNMPQSFPKPTKPTKEGVE